MPCYTRGPQATLFFAMSITWSLILLTVFNLMLCFGYIALRMKLIRMLRGGTVHYQVYVLSIYALGI